MGVKCMPSNKQISLRIPAKTYEDFVFICMMKKTKMATEIKNFIDRFIKENAEILRYDDTHYQILVETEDGKRRWITVTQEEEKRDYEQIGLEGKAIYKKKSEKT
jgi:hypothetical protein